VRKFLIPISLILLGSIFYLSWHSKTLGHLLILEGEDTMAIGGKIKDFSERELILIPGVGDKLAKEILRSKTLIDAKGVGEKTEKKLKKYLDKK